MKITELNTNEIKKIGFKKVHFRYHNKNKSGGNFAINLIDYCINAKNYEISGEYDINGDIHNLRIGELWRGLGTLLNYKLSPFNVFLPQIKGIIAEIERFN